MLGLLLPNEKCTANCRDGDEQYETAHVTFASMMRASPLCRNLALMVISVMGRLGRLSIAVIAVWLAHSAGAQTYQGKELVKASLQANTSAIVPGKPFNVGLLLRMAPGWHTYW